MQLVMERLALSSVCLELYCDGFSLFRAVFEYSIEFFLSPTLNQTQNTMN